MKNKMILNFIIYLSLSSGVGCNKESPPTPIPTPPNPYACMYGLCDTSKLNLVWQVPLSKDTAEWGSIEPIIYRDNVVFSKEMLHYGDDTLKAFNKKTGKLQWEWNDYLLKNTGNALNCMYESSGKLFVNTFEEVHCINAEDGKLIWTSEAPDRHGHPFSKLIGEDLYHVHQKILNKAQVSSTLVKHDINTGAWSPIFTQDSFGKYETRLQMPSKWTSPEGHEILIFQARFVDFSFSNNSPDWIDVVGYDTQDKKEYFRFRNIDSLNMSGSTKTAFILNNKAYMPLQNRIVCIDLLTKKILWYKSMNPGVGFSSGNPFVFVENKFFVKPDDRVLYQLNPDTGAEIWVDKDNGSGCSDIVYHKGLLYYTCSGNGKIYAVEVATGKKIWAEPSPNKFPNPMNGNRRRSNANIGFGGVAIDSTLGYLYTSDFYFGMCLKLPK
jgi:outer membrane protein assembly factor BamB